MRPPFHPSGHEDSPSEARWGAGDEDGQPRKSHSFNGLRRASLDISIVVPVLNEAENLPRLVREITAAMDSATRSFELIIVDDASTDATWSLLTAARQQDPRVRGLRLARQSGQSVALWTGLQAATAPVIGTLDGDLQNDPADLPKLLAHLPECDFVSGHRVHRHDSWLRRVSSRVAAWARHAALGARFQDTGCALRVFKRTALTGVFPFNGLHRFLPILVQGGGGKVREVPVQHRPRAAGVSKYGVWNRLGRGLFDLMAMAWYQRRRVPPTSFTELP